MEKSSTVLLMSAKVLHDTYDKGKSIIQKYIYIYILTLMTIYEHKVLHPVF